MDRLVFKIVFLGFSLATFFIRLPYHKASKQITVSENRQSAQEKILLILVFSGMMFVPIIYLVTPLLDFANYQLPLWAGILGVVLWFPAIGLFYLSHRDLGRNWSPTLEVRDEHKLVTNGIYRSVRHPMYSSIWLMVSSQALLLQNYIAGFAGLISFVLMYILRVPQEEKMMLDRFGDEYREYMKRAGRIIPKIF